MFTIRNAEAPDSLLTGDVTHVLSWLPNTVSGRSGVLGCWELRTVRAWTAPPSVGSPVASSGDFSWPLSTLTEWTAEQAGFPVTLDRAEVKIRPAGATHRFGGWTTVPMFYVRKATA
jgi:hypothetical protein